MQPSLDMEQILFGLYAVIVIGSLCGLRAIMRLGELARRLEALEQRLARGEVPPAIPASRGAALHAPPVGLAPAVHASLASDSAAGASPPFAPVSAFASASSPAQASVPPPSPVFAPVRVGVATSAVPPRSADADWWHRFELRAGTRWITWLGAGALVIAAALFVKLAIDRGWLGPAARLALGGAGGVGLLLAGRRAHRAEMRPLAQGLLGAGLGVLYVATYVAFASYGLIARELVFGAMIGVTVTGCALAIRHDAQPVAVLALLGGLLTPLAVSSGGGSRDALCAYLLVLDAGALAIALARRWHALELLALAGTWVLFGGWLARADTAGAAPAELAWLAAFQALFLAAPLGAHLRRRLAAGPDRALLTAANAAVALACAAVILDGNRTALGAAALVMAILHGVLEAISRRGGGAVAGARVELGFLRIAVALATLSVPLVLRGHGVTLAWSLEAPALLALGYHDRRAALRRAALGVLALAMIHGVILRWPLHAAGFWPFSNPAFAAALIAPFAAWWFAGVHHARRDRGDARDARNAVAAVLASGVAVLALVHNELARWLALAGRRDLADAAVPLVWAMGSLLALALAFAAPRRRPLPPAIEHATALAALLAAALCLFAYRAPAHPDALLALNLRFVAAAVTALALAANAAALGRRDPARGRLLWIAAIAGFGATIGAEAYLHYAVFDAAASLAHAGRRAHTALSIAWSAYAAVLLAIGFARGRRTLRLAGLGLLGLVAVKLLLIDLAGAPQAYRVLSFLIVGALMIAVSYAYHRLERRAGPPEA